MSLTYLQSNQFNYQDIPANAIIYRSGTSGFETIQQSQGVLMSDGSTYSFGIPTAEELVSNYKGNSIIMTQFNKLVEVPVEGTSPNKLLRYINNAWKIVDFSVEYIKPELYDPSSWQLWIADNDINVINIPKDNISTNYYGVKYNEATDQFDIINPSLFSLTVTRDYWITYVNGDAFAYVSANAYVASSFTDIDSNQYTCIFSSNLSKIFNGDITNKISGINTFPTKILENIYGVVVFGGLYIDNVNEYTSVAKGVCLVTDGISSFTLVDSALTRYINRIIKVNNSVTVPAEFYAYNTEKVTFTRTPDIYIMIKKNINDTATYRWCYNRNFCNVLVTSRD